MRALVPGLLLLSALAAADELSGADKLRVLYSPQFTLTREGLPLVTVRIAEGLKEVRLRGPMRVLPDGEMGAEVVSGQDLRVRLVAPGRRAEERYHVIVSRAPAADAEKLQKEARAWRERGFAPRIFEIGTVFGIRGAVIDARKLLLAVAPHGDEAAAKKEAQGIGERFHVETSVYTEVLARPQGVVEAQDERGMTVRNEGVLWFAPLPADGTLKVEPTGRSYFGEIYVTPDRSGTLAVVNAVPEDRLLFGLVPAEMNPGSPLEALKAQAVAARNQLLAKVGARHVGEPYRLCASQHCQVYAGAAQESPRATEAVLATRGELLVEGQPGAETLVDTVYSASCGGHTEDNDLAWGTRPEPILRGQLDLLPAQRRGLERFARIGEGEVAAWLGLRGEPRPYCARPRGAQGVYRWQAHVSAETILLRAGAIGALVDMKVLERGSSGRVVALRLSGTKGEKDVRTELEVRRVLGGLKSALIAITPVRRGDRIESLDILGGGHGHGVGMCQWGAVGLGEAGKGYRQILEHYYPGSRLRRFY